ncbi:hypothetical protein [Synechococcus sp. M16CYN]|uniref:hypothetical protein n=1 Tax=Synechococcus sp. M16CYN TaxID=3103139 RepID=UPI00333EEB1B
MQVLGSFRLHKLADDPTLGLPGRIRQDFLGWLPHLEPVLFYCGQPARSTLGYRTYKKYNRENAAEVSCTDHTEHLIMLIGSSQLFVLPIHQYLQDRATKPLPS